MPFRSNIPRVRATSPTGEQAVKKHEYETTAKVGKDAAVPFTARASIEARMKPNTASNAVFWDEKRQSSHLTISNSSGVCTN